jgi:formate hydrogenlyase subunit 4
MLAENARIPFDDPTTHLELTMVHEVMVLDHSGPDLAIIEYTQALKLWLFAQLISGVALHTLNIDGSWIVFQGLGFTFGIAIIIGVVESTMARLPMMKLHHAAGVMMVLCAVSILVQGMLV